MPYADPDRQREYMRLWIASRRAEYFTGKNCVNCDSTEQLELDHIDRTVKIDHKIWSWSKARREAELVKCQILCKECHKKKTAQEESGIFSGEGSAKAKLTEEQARYILDNQEISAKELASLFKVSRYAIYSIRKGYRWRYLKGDDSAG
jgi:5-methylcytosine-specific restriction endonuclease McrA